MYADPRFSPDGSRIAYVSTQPSGYFNVYVRPFRDGGWSGPAEAVTSDNSFGRSRLYFGSACASTDPSWMEGAVEAAWRSVEALHARVSA